MKIYEFKIACFSVACVFAFFALLAFGIIWLNNGFDVEEKMRKLDLSCDHKIKTLKENIMPSAFKGLPSNSSHTKASSKQKPLP